MHRILKDFPIYQQPAPVNEPAYQTHVPQGIHVLQDDETLEDGLVRRWCHGTPHNR